MPILRFYKTLTTATTRFHKRSSLSKLSSHPFKTFTMASHTLSPDFMSEAAPNITKSKIDWSQTALPEYSNAYAVVLDNVLTPLECAQLVAAAEAHNNGTWDLALLRSGQATMRLATEIRNSERILWDDADIVARLWARVAPHVPELQTITNQPDVTGRRPVIVGEIWDVMGLNERMRFLRYGPGEYFRTHRDGAYERPESGGKERTMFTLQLYLNEADEENPLVGGATTFHDSIRQSEREHHVHPKCGRVLIFQHRDLLHSGQEVEKGIKLTLRTDLFFRKRDEVLPQEDRIKVEKKAKPKYQYLSRRQGGNGKGNAGPSAAGT